MSERRTVQTEANCRVSVRVPRGETGDLRAGVEAVLAKVDGVRDARVERVAGVRPTWTDLRVDAEVSLSIDVAAEDPTEGGLATRLEDGFGVTGVTGLVVDAD